MNAWRHNQPRMFPPEVQILRGHARRSRRDLVNRLAGLLARRIVALAYRKRRIVDSANVVGWAEDRGAACPSARIELSFANLHAAIATRLRSQRGKQQLVRS